MLSRQQLIKLRIFHLTILFASALCLYQLSQWDDALWIPISVLAIIGPFGHGLSINKAKERMLGSIAGLLISIIIWFLIHYSYNLLVPVALALVYLIAFSVLQNYTYFIMLVTLMLSINFDYMNLFFNDEFTFIANRAICVLTGVAICQIYEYLLFRKYYDNAISLVETEKIDMLIVAVWDKVKELSDKRRKVNVEDLNKCIEPLLDNLAKLTELKECCLHSYSNQASTLDLIEKYEAKILSLYNWLMNMGYSLLNHKKSAIGHERQYKDHPHND